MQFSEVQQHFRSSFLIMIWTMAIFPRPIETLGKMSLRGTPCDWPHSEGCGEKVLFKERKWAVVQERDDGGCVLGF